MQHHRGKKLASLSIGLVHKGSRPTLPTGVSTTSHKPNILGRIQANNFCKENHLIRSLEKKLHNVI